MNFKKITLTLPESLLGESEKLMDAGYFANISDLVRAGIREEIKEFAPIIEKKQEWKAAFEKLQQNFKKYIKVKKSENEIIDDLRKIRREIWEEKHKRKK